MTRTTTQIAIAVTAALAVAGCADGSTGLLSTSALGTAPATATATAAKTDPACVALTARIDALRKDGVVERVEKVAAGKSATVSVKRDSLAKMAELDRANAEFQAKCALPLTTASVRPSAAPVAAPVTATAAAPVQPTQKAASAAKP